MIQVTKNTLDDPTCVNGGMYYRSAGTHQAKICINGSWTALGVPRVTSLPANPSNGDEVYYAVTSPIGGTVLWHLRYQGSAWDFLGGSPLFDEEGAQATTSASGWQIPSDKLSIYVPRAGIYEVTIGARLYSSTHPNLATGISTSGAGTVVGTTVVISASDNGNTYGVQHNYRTTRQTLTAGTLEERLARLVGGSGTVHADSRLLMIKPIKLN